MSFADRCVGSPPPEQLERVRQSNLTEGLSFVLRQLNQGGGGKKLTERVRQEMREKYDPDGTLSLDEIRQKVAEAPRTIWMPRAVLAGLPNR